MGMDVNLFYFGVVFLIILALLAVGVGRQRGALFGFVGFVVGIVFMAQLNTDGSISGLSSGASTGIFPWFYIPLMLTILNIGMAAYEGTR